MIRDPFQKQKLVLNIFEGLKGSNFALWGKSFKCFINEYIFV